MSSLPRFSLPLRAAIRLRHGYSFHSYLSVRIANLLAGRAGPMMTRLVVIELRSRIPVKALTEIRQLPRIVRSQSVFSDGQVAPKTMGWQFAALGWTTASVQVDAKRSCVRHDESLSGK